MAIIREIWDKCKGEWFVGLIFILGLTLAFGLGRLSLAGPTKAPVSITGAPTANLTASAAASAKNPVITNLTNNKNNGDARVVASRQGSKYHYPWCSGAKRIKPENLVEYESSAAAQAAGLTPAGNCPGL